MTRKRTRTVGVSAVGIALLGCLALVCCQQPTAQVEATRAPGAESRAPARPTPVLSTPPVNPNPAPAAAPKPAPEPATSPPPGGEINMDQPEEPREPPPPPFLAVMEEIDPANRSKVNVTLTPPRKLVLDTDNVKRLRLTRERLPLTRNRSIVLQIDGQGIEWTANHVAIELERSTAGEWSVVRRRPDKP